MHVYRLAGNDFSRDHTFFFGFVREQFAAAYVADGKHVRQIRALLIVDDDFTTRTDRESKCRCVNTAQQRFPTHRHEHVVRVDRRRCAVFFNVNRHAVRTNIGTRHLRARVNLEPLLAKRPVGFLHDVVIVTGQNRRRKLDDCHVRTKSTPH